MNNKNEKAALIKVSIYDNRRGYIKKGQNMRKNTKNACKGVFNLFIFEK